MNTETHRLLARQLSKLDLTETLAPDAKTWSAFVGVVNRAYQDGDQDRYTLERSVALSSEEMQTLYQEKSTHEAHLRSIVESLNELIWLKDPSGVYLNCNPMFERFMGMTEADMVGKTDAQLGSRANASFLQVCLDRDLATDTQERWVTYGHDQQPALLEIETVQVLDGSGKITGVRGRGRDITEQRRTQEKIKNLAFFDSLTGLPNRILVMDRLKQAAEASAREQVYGTLLFIDLDHFKLLNDTLGHEAGDYLLQQVAQRLTLCARSVDTVARLGGDEFVVVLINMGKNSAQATANTELIGKKILGALNQPYLINGVTHRSTPSLGATLFRGNETDIPTLLKQADMAMYKSKAAGRNTLCFFDPELENAVMQRVRMEHDLRLALSEKQFVPHYQAQVDDEGFLSGVELLIRWEHPLRGMVSPAEFIPVAEETRLIVPLGLWILEQACMQLAAWALKPYLAHLTLAVNVSAHEFLHPDFLTRLFAILKHTQANPTQLKLELTESLLISRTEDVIAKMHHLKANGIGLSLDDFGMGYSSLSYLQRMPLKQLKIDQSFIRDMLIDMNDASIVKAIVDLGHNLGLNVIAEGVETELQRDFLRRLGCKDYQGYLYSRPLPLAQFESYAKKMPVPV